MPLGIATINSQKKQLILSVCFMLYLVVCLNVYWGDCSQAANCDKTCLKRLELPCSKQTGNLCARNFGCYDNAVIGTIGPPRWQPVGNPIPGFLEIKHTHGILNITIQHIDTLRCILKEYDFKM